MSTARAPKALGGTTGGLFLYLPDVDAAFRRAVEAGCKVLMPVTDMFWGDRFGKLEDPFGNQWSLATHKEDVSRREQVERAKSAMAKLSPGGPDARDPRLGHHRRRRQALYGGELESRA